MPDMIPVTLKNGQKIRGFEVTRVTELPAEFSVAYELRHIKTGSHIIHLHAADAENLFSITFPTPPSDSTGVPHIIEHAVLGGSSRFPVKDPFFEMIKMSMATFINAMTGYDHTFYPVASNVRRDFFNLAEVYWDAVFHPTLTHSTFLREAHHLEPADPSKPDGPLITKGIVYNEMKGVFSNPNSLVGRASFRGMFPDNIYGNESGGDPKAITDLTYDQFRQFHQRFYHPTNALIFLYGDIPTTDHLAWLEEKLNGFESRPAGATIKPQPLWKQPQVKTLHYPIGATDTTSAKTFITLNWMVGDGAEVEHVMAFDVLDAVLLGNQAAPLRRAIIESKLGADLTHSGYHAGLLQGTFHIGIKGSEPDRAEAFVQLVINTLQKIATDGIDPERIDAAFQQLAYDHLEIGGNFPLRQLSAVKSAWLFQKDPLSFIRASEHLQTLRTRYNSDPALFQNLIKRWLLDNPHRLTMTIAPDPTLEQRQEQAERARLDHIRQSLDADALKQIVETAQKLEAEANLPNTPEALATLPQLQVRDLPRKPRHIPTTVEKLSTGTEVLRNDVFANGVNYLQLDIDLSAVPQDLLQYLPLYSDCVRKMGAAGTSYVQMAERVSSSTGGVSFSGYCGTHVVDPDNTLRRGRLGLKFLDANADRALSVVKDLLFELNVRDHDRLRDVIQQAASAHRNSIVERGLSLATHHAARGLNRETFVEEQLGGLPQMRLAIHLADHFEKEYDGLIEKLETLRAHLLHLPTVTASFTGSGSVQATVYRTLEAWGRQMAPHSPPAARIDFTRSSVLRNEGLAFPMQVSFCTRAMPAPHISDPDAPLLTVGTRILGLDYLLDEIRFKGTAYGGGCSYNPTAQTMSFYSYRDPWVGRTLKVFDGSSDWIRDLPLDKSRIDRAIISTAKNAERPIRPAEATSTALSRHISGDTPQRREAFHEALLAATPDRVRSTTLRVLEQNYSIGGVCVVSSHQKLAEAPLDIEELM